MRTSLRLQGRAERAARLAARDRVRSVAGGAGASAGGGRDAPRGNSPHHPAAARLSAVATAAAARCADPRALAASAERRKRRRAYANRAILPARPFLKQSKIIVKAVWVQDNPATVQLQSTCTREDGLVRDLGSVRSGAYRNDGYRWMLMPWLHGTIGKPGSYSV